MFLITKKRVIMRKHKIGYATFIIMFLLMVGTLYYQKAENWSYVDSFYFTTMTLTTIGYGDLVPTNAYTKIFTSVYVLLGIGVMIYLLGTVMGGYIYEHEKYFNKIIRKVKRIKRLIKYNLPEEEEGSLHNRYKRPK